MSSRSYVKESTTSKITCNEIVLSLVGQDKELAEKWWYGPNKAFGMETPITQNTKDVYEYLLRFI